MKTSTILELGLGIALAAVLTSTEAWGDAEAIANDRVTTIDVLFVATGPAMKAAGDETRLKKQVDAALNRLNETMHNSGIKGSFASVGLKITNQISEVRDAESDSNPYWSFPWLLNRINANEQALRWRGESEADIVCLLITEGAKQVSGYAHKLTRPGDYSMGYHGFCVVTLDGLIPAVNTLAKEVGRLMGCAEQRGFATADGRCPWSHAFNTEGNVYCTTMADTGFGGKGSCRKLHAYSSPRTWFDPIGKRFRQGDKAPGKGWIRLGSPTCADNSRTIRRMLPDVATWGQQARRRADRRFRRLESWRNQR